jgi:hypothetical protein
MNLPELYVFFIRLYYESVVVESLYSLLFNTLLQNMHDSYLLCLFLLCNTFVAL